MLHIPLNIKHLRELRGMKQKDVADAIGMRPNTISNYENGKSNPSHDDLVRLADFFGVSVEMMMRENLAEKFVTLNEMEQWKEREAKAKAKGKEHFQALALSPVWLETLKEHYVGSVSRLTGQQKEDVLKELETIFQRRLKEFQDVTRGTDYASQTSQ